MKTFTDYLFFNTRERREMVRITFRKWCRGTVTDVELAFRVAHVLETSGVAHLNPVEF